MDATLIETVVKICPFLTFFVALAALLISLNWYDTLKRLQTYSDLDRLLLELLKLGMDNPRFVNPKYTTNYKKEFDEDERFRYETYAFIAWNICETIYDRKLSDERNKWKRAIEIFNRSNLKHESETWKPVIEAENKLHRKWFNNPENFHKFKDEFREYIQNDFPEKNPIKEIAIAEMENSNIRFEDSIIRFKTLRNDEKERVNSSSKTQIYGLKKWLKNDFKF